jgi:hypothetical protein
MNRAIFRLRRNKHMIIMKLKTLRWNLICHGELHPVERDKSDH